MSNKYFMKGMRLFKTIILLLSAVILNSQVNAQYKQKEKPAVILGWSDDTHYLIKMVESGKSVIQNVDIKTGKGVIVPPVEEGQEDLIESLIAGTSISKNDDVSPDMQSIVTVIDNDLYLFKSGEKEPLRLTSDRAAEMNPRFSPDGKKIAYTRNKDLYVFDLSNNKEIRLTSDASEKIYNGYASWVYMEEILGRTSNYAAFWWSPDGNKLAYLRTDESDVPVFTLNRADETSGIHGQVEAVPYPKAGDPNPKVKMGIADIATAKTTWVKTDNNVDQYIAWPFWTIDSKKLAIQIVNREQNEISIILADPSSGDFSQIYFEARKTWLDFFQDIYVMKNGTGFIVRSYRSDWENLYHYSLEGKLIRQLTNFDFSVTGIDRVDEKAGMVYFSATGKESTEKHLFRVGLNGKNLIQLTNGSGTHEVNISPNGSYFLDTWSNINDQGSIVAIDKKGKIIREVFKTHKPEKATASSRRELVRIMTSDGLFNMPAIITYPVNFDKNKKYPVVFSIYGGPATPNISNEWSDREPSWYALNGIINFTVDHRGSGHFGRRGTDYLYRSLGKWELLDYADAVKWLREKPFVDGSRMGITGSSYGGYVTCLALTKGSEFWTHGFAGSSVTDFRFYDNIYTERFMDLPNDNAEGYNEGSVLSYINNYKGKLYLTHGDMDDNVHMQNSLHLISMLQDAGKSFTFMIYPGQRHGFTMEKAKHSQKEAHDFWMKSFFPDNKK